MADDLRSLIENPTEPVASPQPASDVSTLFDPVATVRKATEERAKTWSDLNNSDLRMLVEHPETRLAPKLLEDAINRGASLEETTARFKANDIRTDQLKPHFQALQQQKQMEAARAKEEADRPTSIFDDLSVANRSKWLSAFGENFVKNSVPFYSAVRNFRDESRAADAQKKFLAGTATAEDMATIAHHETLAKQAETMQKYGGVAGRAVNLLGSVPTVLGESQVAGMGTKALFGEAKTFAGSIGRNLATTLLMPSFYLEDTARRNIAAGRDPLNWRGFAPAYTMGYLNTMVLGRLQGRDISILSNAARGMAEKQAVDAVAGVIDLMLPNRTGGKEGEGQLGTGFGVIGKLGRGEYGEAGKEALVDFLTFGTFAGLHKLGPKGEIAPAATEEVKSVTRSFEAAIKHLTDKGATAEHAAGIMKTFGDKFTTALKKMGEDGLTKDVGEALIEDYPAGPVKDYFSRMVDATVEAGPTKKESPAEKSAREEREREAIEAIQAFRQKPAEPKSATVADLTKPQEVPPTPEKPPESSPVAAKQTVVETPPAPGIAHPGSTGSEIPAPLAPGKPETAKGLRLGDTGNMRSVLAKPGMWANVVVHDSTGKQVGNLAGHVEGDTLKDANIWMDHVKPGGTRGHDQGGVKEQLAIGKQLAEAFPELNKVEFDPVKERINRTGEKAGKPHVIDLSRWRKKPTKEEKASIAPQIAPATPIQIEKAKTNPIIGAGEPPQAGLVVASVGPDGKVYYGKPGWTHGHIVTEFGGLRRWGAATDAQLGFAGPDGKFLSREEAFRKLEAEQGPLGQTLDHPIGQLGSAHLNIEKEVSDVVAKLTADGLPPREARRVADATEAEGVHLADTLPVPESEAAGRSPAHAPEAPGSSPRNQEARPRTDAGVRRPEPAPVTPEHLAEQRILAQGHWDMMSASERAEMPAKLRRAFEMLRVNLKTKPGRGLDYEPGESERGKSEEIPLDPEHERLIDESTMKPGMKAAVKLLMQGAPIRDPRLGKLTGGLSGEAVRKAAKKLFGESPWEKIERDAAGREAALREKGKTAEFGEGGFLHGPTPEERAAAEAAGGKPAEAGPAPTPYEIINADRAAHGLTSYSESVPGRGARSAAYDPKAEAALTGKMSAQDIGLALHETAHHIEKTNAFPFDKLSPSEAEGFKQFNYAPGLTGKAALKEGFAEWYRLRAEGKLGTLTGEKVEASMFAEEWASEKGLTKAMDATREAFAKYDALPPEGKAAAHMAMAAREADPWLSGSEAGHAFVESVLDDLAAVRRMEADYEKRTGKTIPREERLSTVLSQLMGKERAIAGEYSRDGAWTVIGGKKVRIGLSDDQITAGLKPKEMTKSASGGPSKFDVYATARHVLGERTRAEEARRLANERLDKAEAAAKTPGTAVERTAKWKELAEAREAYDKTLKDTVPGFELVPAEQLEIYRKAMEEFKKDPDFAVRAEAAAQRLTKTFLDLRRVLESPDVHLYRPGTTAEMDAKRPDYIPTYRVTEGSGGKPGGKAGEHINRDLHARAGSGEPIVAPMISLKRRQQAVATLFAAQMKRNAIMSLGRLEGMGEHILSRPEIVRDPAAVKGTLDEKRMADLGLDPDVLRDLGVMDGFDLLASPPWPTDGSKPTIYWHGPDGVLTSARVADRSLYELATNQQIDAHQTARIINGIANLSVLGIKPFQWVSDKVRKGATFLSLAFQFRNVPRDSVELLKNTITGIRARDIPGAYANLYRYYAKELWARATGTEAKQDPLLKKFINERGDELRQFNEWSRGDAASAYEKAQAGEVSKSMKTVNSIWNFGKDLFRLAGAGELAPRFLEWKRRLSDMTGKSEDQLRKEFEAADEAAKDGKPYVDPVPWHVMLDGMEAAAESTVNFNRQGTLTRQFNRIQPFFGPAISGMSKAVRAIRENPARALTAMGGLVALRIMHWLMVKDEDWYTQLSAHDKYTNFAVSNPMDPKGLPIRLPGPRDLDVVAGGAFITTLDYLFNKSPDFKGYIEEAFGAVAPPVPTSPGVHAAWDVATNKNFMGTPIVPKAQENLSGTDKFLNYQLPYVAEQLTGGRGSKTGLIRGFNPLPEIHPHRSIEDFYSLRDDLRAKALVAKNRGERFTDENQLHRVEAAAKQMAELRTQLAKNKDATDADKQAVNQRMVALAKRALGQ